MTNQQGAPEALRLAEEITQLMCFTEAAARTIAAAADELCRLHYENKRLAALVEAQQPAPSAAAALPEGWVPLVITHEGQYPEEVAYGPQVLMDRLGKWLRKYFDHVVASKAQPSPTPQADSQPAPIDMVLHCPACGLQHIDEPEEERSEDVCEGPDVVDTVIVGWDNPPHRSHLCHGCGYIWRPADVPTNGVAAVKTIGKADSPIAARAPADSGAAPAGWKLVPIEPSVDQEWEGKEASSRVSTMAEACKIYKAMLAAAPTPPAQAADSVLEDAARLEALHAAVTAIYLDDSSDFKSALGAVVRHLDPKLAGDLLAWPKRAFDISQARLDAARKQGGAV